MCVCVCELCSDDGGLLTFERRSYDMMVIITHSCEIRIVYVLINYNICGVCASNSWKVSSSLDRSHNARGPHITYIIIIWVIPAEGRCAHTGWADAVAVLSRRQETSAREKRKAVWATLCSTHTHAHLVMRY